MNRNEFLAALDEMLELDPGTLKGGETLDDIDSWDSLAVISFIALVDEKFNTVVAGEDLAKAKTVDDLLALVSDHVTA
ncbi:phosphopantetheine-binding protein [Nitrospirillum amazonense]|uniref:Acyl carrier protein n=1 Tax=Nitrospirillum amazonense TaxID=28077 RepID=A0A560KHV2_9PROT|nr:phosphopantetheine-binding protein [Nitrospirillum amazonense]MDG3443003.1 phosphopantetheine-binding protein [Nitrospirillum amazonense]TWB82855.1 acyl carrier protein [Nitrospirillum amazonense]